MTVISISQFKNALSTMLNRVAFGRERIIVTSRGQPKAAVVSIDDLERLEILDNASAIREGIREYEPGVTVPVEPVKPGQEWFWTTEWQAAEREAEADLAAGRYKTFDNDETFLASLV